MEINKDIYMLLVIEDSIKKSIKDLERFNYKEHGMTYDDWRNIKFKKIDELTKALEYIKEIKNPKQKTELDDHLDTIHFCLYWLDKHLYSYNAGLRIDSKSYNEFMYFTDELKKLQAASDAIKERKKHLNKNSHESKNQRPLS